MNKLLALLLFMLSTFAYANSKDVNYLKLKDYMKKNANSEYNNEKFTKLCIAAYGSLAKSKQPLVLSKLSPEDQVVYVHIMSIHIASCLLNGSYDDATYKLVQELKQCTEKLEKESKLKGEFLFWLARTKVPQKNP